MLLVLLLASIGGIMASTPFSIFKRSTVEKATGKNVVKYCARFYDDDGAIVKTKTLAASTPSKAAIEAKSMLDTGGGTAQTNPLALDFLRDFWKQDSDYVKMKRLKGRPLSARYIDICAAVVKKHLSTPLKGIRLHALTVNRMERIVLDFAAAGMNPRSINYVIGAVKVPISHHARRNRTPDPLQYLGLVAYTPKQRGVLSIDEIKKIIELESESPRVIAAMLLGSLGGLRLGEVRGLQWADVDEGQGLVHIVGNYVDAREGRKSPKYGSTRDVPLTAPVLAAVKLCAAIAPAGSQYVFFNDTAPDKPGGKQIMERGFRDILAKIGIDDAARKSRNLVFHGLRHTFVSLSRSQGLPDFVTMRLAGHKSAAMMERYSHANGQTVDFKAARDAFNGALDKAAGVEA